MSYSRFANDIVELVGGEQNISNLVHCATRLRFKLKDKTKANKSALQNLDGVLSVVENGGQFQVVVGSHVSEVYKEITKVSNMDMEADSPDESKGGIGARIFEVISRSFSPLLGAMAGAGMLKALLTILTMTGVLSDKSGTYFILSAAGNAVFYFLPIFLGITLATKLGANPYVGGTIGAALLEPNFTSLLTHTGDISHFLGIPVVLMEYSSSVFPVFIAVSMYALLDKFLKRIIHKDLQMFLVPMLSLMIIVPLTVIAFGPLGVYVGNAIGAGIDFLSTKSGILTGAVVGAGWTFLTLFGLHWGLVPLILDQLAHGGSTLFAMLATAPLAQAGLAFGIFLRTRDKSLKTLSGSALVPALLSGVTEPVLYGLMMRYKKTIPYVIISAAVGGAINGMLGVKALVYVFPSALSIPAFAPMGIYIIAIGVAFAGATLMTLIFGFKDKKKRKVVSDNKVEVRQALTKKEADNKVETSESLIKKEVIISPLTGEIKPLVEVNDSVFASETMGKGIAVEPTVGQAVSPVNGVVSSVFPTGHAIGIMSDEGAEVLIHIGINTVQLGGKYYSPLVKQGDRIKQGDLLVNFDIEKIKESGYPVTTPIIITNTDRYVDIVGNSKGTVRSKEGLLTLIM
ncbi:beta-glucoside-specific PTS transporter subunit IIABC [Bacillus cytotoxicus]|uniref:beta-glucoside-specific PTS transporter subunit IIABC n=1 Tax=Bacillus cytotoxicus TaxID=580165 RepID=UPI000B95DFF8|nr:beta-glucoside-specific PTS transporter subunit IIABC [Bacillus cytotoxicus]AWC28133.1 PTS beta-glucoside transporter subunit EIIBCA [Bacillus cytotoxicus]AWC40484.1 PTS beta-glucoside transporter subunit EIIBCA [Bacillus cytotoxicus]AWC48415.1 PTS beta-glucoside transporter subunit EIIBCA [Bacillus cytotoxicus]AWC52199.1 PTS beta-glucoside transporter subunit EIIBCA [Bacillus cytotoxicus]AWC56334.1 PTS beta-glucoside transporter subunit EIIBCA [Bacillus cytotoxicus]